MQENMEELEQKWRLLDAGRTKLRNAYKKKGFTRRTLVTPHSPTGWDKISSSSAQNIFGETTKNNRNVFTARILRICAHRLNEPLIEGEDYEVLEEKVRASTSKSKKAPQGQADEPLPPSPYQLGNQWQSELWLKQTITDSNYWPREEALRFLDDAWSHVLNGKETFPRIICVVAIGGAGKTTLVSRWAKELQEREGKGGAEAYLDWSFYNQGVSEDDKKALPDSSEFIGKALLYFGRQPREDDNQLSSKDKGRILADFIVRQRTLLILDGLETIQSPTTGKIVDEGILGLFSGLQTDSRSLCVVTTRREIAPLDRNKPGIETFELLPLTDEEGARWLKALHVKGSDEELQLACREAKGHALTISLIGRYLATRFKDDVDGPDIRKRALFRLDEADDTAPIASGNKDAFRVIAAYERWFEQSGWDVELAVLRLIGLFDRPAAPHCLDALRASPAIPGLTEDLVSITPHRWYGAIDHLFNLGLISKMPFKFERLYGYTEETARIARADPEADIGRPDAEGSDFSYFETDKSLDTHPIIRDYFGRQLVKRGVAERAHGRLFEHLKDSVPFWPEGKEGLAPLYQAIVHGCRAKRFDEAYQAYQERISRGIRGKRAWYSHKTLGLIEMNLSTLTAFFDNFDSSLTKPDPDLDQAKRAWVASIVSFNLRALNRLTHAKRLAQFSLHAYEGLTEEQPRESARVARDLSELELILGNLSAAVKTAHKAAEYAGRTSDPFEKMGKLAVLGDALNEAGELQSSRQAFQRAEKEQEGRSNEKDRNRNLLYGVQGFQYCDLLLTTIERVAWRDWMNPEPTPIGQMQEILEELVSIEARVQQTLKWNQEEKWEKESSLDYLTLGKVFFFRAVLSKVDAHSIVAEKYLQTSRSNLRHGYSADNLPRVLLAYAWLSAWQGRWEIARENLEEAFLIATRDGRSGGDWEGCMRLQLVDVLLYRARLFGGARFLSAPRNSSNYIPRTYPWSESSPLRDIEQASVLITKCGYGRRTQELKDARAMIGSQVE